MNSGGSNSENLNSGSTAPIVNNMNQPLTTATNSNYPGKLLRYFGYILIRLHTNCISKKENLCCDNRIVSAVFFYKMSEFCPQFFDN